MRTAFCLLMLGLVVQPLPVAAQTLAPGKYTGSIHWTGAGKPMQEMVTLTIDTVEGNQFQGVAWVGTKRCRVDTPVQGQLSGDTLRVTGKPIKEDCGVRWELKVDGNKLQGTTPAGHTIVLSK